MVYAMGKDKMIDVGISEDDPTVVVSLPLEHLEPIIEVFLKQTPKWLIDHIDDQLKLCRKQKVKRTSTAWGIWSTCLNIATKNRVADKDPESDKLELTFQYWQLTSQLLDLYFGKIRWFGGAKIKQKRRQIKEIRRLIV